MRAVLQMQIDDRREERDVAHRDAEFAPVGSAGVPGTVTDLSRSGFRILVDGPLAADAVVWLRVGDHGPFMARVVWFDGMAAGCEFAGTLHPSLVAEMLRG